MSHDINADADLWKARQEIGEKALSIWLEFLSIADRNEGYLPGDHDQLIRHVADKCRSTKTRVSLVYDFALTRLWVKCDPTARVVNFAKYHRSRVPNKSHSEPSEPSEPNHIPPKSPKGDVIDFAFQRFWEAYPKKKAKQAAIKAWKKEAAYLTDIQDRIMMALARQKKQTDWIKDNGQYVPNPASWLNGRRWEDEIKTRPDIFSVPSRTPEQILAERERERRQKNGK